MGAIMSTLQELLDSDPYDAARRLADDQVWSALTADDAPVACLVYAVLAQSPHNTQAWRWRVGPGVIELWADRSRALTVSDPDGRELAIGGGCALENLSIALTARGFEHTVEPCPSSGEPDLLARVSVGPGAAQADAETVALFAATPERRTNRSAYFGEPVPEAVRESLRRTVVPFSTVLTFADEDMKDALSELVVEGDRHQMGDAGFRKELSSWMRRKGTSRGDGMPADLLGQRGIAAYIAPEVVRSVDVGKGQSAKDRELIASSPTLVVLSTERDGQREWVACGRALARVTLQLHRDGFACAYMNQPCELPELRGAVAGVVGVPNPQLVLRVGKSASNPPASPRRPVAQVLMAPFAE